MVVNKYLAEFLGTFILVFFGSMGILAIGGAVGAAEIVVISFAFGLALLAGIWAVAHVSGAHFNPAVTLAMLMDGRTSFGDAIGYWVAQFAGATVASLVVMAATSREAVGGDGDRLREAVDRDPDGGDPHHRLRLGDHGSHQDWGRQAAAAIALTLVGVHLAGIPFSGRIGEPGSFVSGQRSSPVDFDQLWVYIVFPLVGGIIAWGLYRLFPGSR